MTIASLTFPLAILGYIGLTAIALLTASGRTLPIWWRLIVLVIATHVLLVWHFHYGWQIASATRNGYAGFLLFHSSLTGLVVSTVVPERIRNRLLWAVYFIVTMGAIGAVFRYAHVAPYRVAVLACAVIGIGGLARAYVRHLQDSAIESGT